MPVLSSAVSALSTFYQDSLDPFDDDAVELSTVPAAGQAAHDRGVRLQEVDRASRSSTRTTRSGLVENFLRMTFGFPAEPYEVDPEFVRALDLLLILHADHEQNCSTSTVRLVGSAQANLFASVSAGINALFGPLHGGANQAVLEMLQRIRDVEDGNVDAFVERVKKQGEGRPADGLRAPGLQELRPAREDRQAERGRGAQEARASPTRCSTSPRRWRSGRWPTTTSSSASSTRTSTSTPA